MTEKKCKSEALIAWVVSIVRKHQELGTYGTIKVDLKNGRINSIKVEENHLPPV